MDNEEKNLKLILTDCFLKAGRRKILDDVELFDFQFSVRHNNSIYNIILKNYNIVSNNFKIGKRYKITLTTVNNPNKFNYRVDEIGLNTHNATTCDIELNKRESEHYTETLILENIPHKDFPINLDDYIQVKIAD